MYIDLSMSSLLFQIMVGILLVLRATQFVGSQQAKAALVRIRRHMRKPGKSE